MKYLALCLLAFTVLVTTSAGQRRDFVTDEEAELIREAQEIDLRIEALTKFIDRRLAAANIAGHRSCGTPGPWSTTLSRTPSPTTAARISAGRFGGLCRTALSTRLAMTRSSRTESAETSGRVSGMFMRTAWL